MIDEEKPCLKCQTEISALAERCPYCGYEPGDKGELISKIIIGFGILISFTGIGMVIGIPLIIAGLIINKKRETGKRPTNTAP